MKTLRGFFRLTPRERRIALQSAVALLFTWAGLRLFSFGRWKKVVAALAPADPLPGSQRAPADTALLIARVQAAVGRHLFFKPNCLEHALALWWLLRKHGVDAHIRIGARKESERFEAHAWVEVGSLVLEPAGDHLHFVPFDRPIPLAENQGR